jgi:hypothetical protein
MMWQKWQPTAMRLAPFVKASSVRLVWLQVPSFSSIHICAPPAPKANDFWPERGISRS